MPRTTIHRIQVDGLTGFYREAGPPDAPVVLLLHGFPTSSFQYRELMPLLADRVSRHRARPAWGFGFTEVPDQREIYILLRCVGEDDSSFHRRAAPGDVTRCMFSITERPTGFRVAHGAGPIRVDRHRVAKRQRL